MRIVIGFEFPQDLARARRIFDDLFTDRKEAEMEAFGRLTAMRAAEAMAAQARSGKLVGPCVVQIRGPDGRVLFEAEVRSGR